MGTKRHALATLVAIISLVITLVAAGFTVCAAPPQTTEVLARTFSGSANPDTPFSHDDLVQAALAARDYTVGSNDRTEIFSVLHAINANAHTPYAKATPDELAVAPEAYTLPADALTHLDDVYRVVMGARIALIAVALVAGFSCAYLAIRANRRALGTALLGAGIIVLATFVALGGWLLIDFNGFFTVFHSLFFANGTWTFSYQSLLITLYPIAFWMGMGAVWLATTCLLSLASIIVGRKLRRA